MAEVPSWTPIEVPTLRLDEFLTDRNAKNVKLLKLDIEGHEHRALSGIEDMLRRGVVRYLLTEVNGYWLKEQGSSSISFMNFLKEVGFKRIVHGNGGAPEKMNSVMLEWTSAL